MTTPLGKYKLVKLIAAGGMAEVYLAKQAGAAGFEKQVCLKRILPHLARDKQFVEMFLNEARLASQLDHPNIVSIFDLGEANGNYFIAMEFIDGPNLRSVARRAVELGELLPIPEVCKIIAQAAGGLQYAHDLVDKDGVPLGLVHRDISPDNVLVHRNGTTKVVDFGIAKAANSSGMTRTGTLKGKVAYMPPEQLRGEPLDRRTDVFALGVVLYELVGGRRPWDAPNEVALIGAIMATEPVPLNELRKDCPAELVRIVHKALAKDQGQRFQSCAELQRDLEQLVVSMGQSITNARIADFVKAYAPPPDTSAQNDGTAAELDMIQEATFGTGMAQPIIGSPGFGAQDPGLVKSGQTESGTVLMPGAALPRAKGKGPRIAVLVFVSVAAVSGAGAWLAMRGPSAGNDQMPVAVERASLPAPVAPRVAAPVVEAQTPVVEPKNPVVEAPPAPAVERTEPGPKPVKPPKVVAKAEPPAAASPQDPAVLIVRQPGKAATPPAPPPAVSSKGEVLFQIRPWATVLIDGREYGATPLPEAIKLSAGEHTVRLVNSELGKDVSRTISVEAGGKTTVRLDLAGE